MLALPMHRASIFTGKILSKRDGKVNIMAKNDLKLKEAAQPEMDDFKLINGIKQGIQHRLQTADILIYAQLASLTPEDILSKLGKVNTYSIKRIEEEDWIGQARELHSKKAQLKPRREETTEPTIRQHYENFTIEFLLDGKNVARRTRVAHVQSGDADTWAGWEAERVLDFITRHAGVRRRITRPTAPLPLKPKLMPSSISTEQSSKVTTETASLVPVKITEENSESLPSFAVARSTPQVPTLANIQSTGIAPLPLPSPQDMLSAIGKINLLDWKISLPNTDQSLHNLPHDQAFDVSLTLDLNDVSIPETSELDCIVALYAKKLGGRNRHLLGETQKTLAFENILVLTISQMILGPGAYRLDALVTLRLAGTDPGHDSGIKAFLESSPLQVY